jgi:4-carboxymuconolactone decarboxylase
VHFEPAGHRDAAFGLAEDEGRVLLVRNDRMIGCVVTPAWDLPGGTVEAGETLDEALRREWREETGLEARVGELLSVSDGRKLDADGETLLYTWRAFVFRVQCRGQPRAGDGIHSAEWVPGEAATASLSAPWHGPVRDLLAGAAPRYGHLRWVEEAKGLLPPPSAHPLRRLCVLSAAAAVGNLSLLRLEVSQALAAGEEPDRIREALLQVVPYAGFPRAITAVAAVSALLPASSGPAGAPAPDAGREAFARVYGDTAERVEEGLRALDPDLARWTLDFAYGRVLARPGLSPLEREVIAVSVLAALGNLDDPLLGHYRAALRLGASAVELDEVLRLLPRPGIGSGSRLGDDLPSQ